MLFFFFSSVLSVFVSFLHCLRAESRSSCVCCPHPAASPKITRPEPHPGGGRAAHHRLLEGFVFYGLLQGPA